MSETVHAIAKHIPMTPTKVRRILAPLRGMAAQAALDALKAMPHAATEPVYKVIRSAMAKVCILSSLRLMKGQAGCPVRVGERAGEVAGVIDRSANVHRTSRSFLRNGFQSSLTRRLFWDARFIPTVFV
jgi:hypothetical protein